MIKQRKSRKPGKPKDTLKTWNEKTQSNILVYTKLFIVFFGRLNSFTQTRKRRRSMLFNEILPASWRYARAASHVFLTLAHVYIVDICLLLRSWTKPFIFLYFPMHIPASPCIIYHFCFFSNTFSACMLPCMISCTVHLPLWTCTALYSSWKDPT